MTDDELEAEINRQYYLVLSSENEDELRERFDRMAQLVAQRSPAQIYRMECERGLH